VSAMRPLPIALALSLLATPALAQFTSTVTAPRRERPEVVEAREDSVRRTDSVSVVERMTAMREWVDSAATAIAADAPPASAADTAATTAVSTGAVDTASVAVSTTTTTTTTEFREGAPAPATATPLPAIAILGLASLLVGAALRRRSP
jgi:hypothetical protein